MGPGPIALAVGAGVVVWTLLFSLVYTFSFHSPFNEIVSRGSVRTKTTNQKPRLISSSYPCLEHIFMVPKVFEPLKFYCIGNYQEII